MKKVNLLSRAEMRRVMGGNELPGGGDGEPGEPSGGGDGSDYKCCLKNNSSVCSRCVPCNASCTCIVTATLVAC